MSVKYQIFVSSTYVDLINERAAITKAVLDLGHIPAGMEMFPASDTEQLSYIKKIIDKCDYYVLVLAGRYGTLDSTGISYTEREYEYALETGKTVLVFIHHDINSISLGKTDMDSGKLDKLLAFRNKVASARLVSQWSDAANLTSQVIIALTKAFSDQPQIGWVRGNLVPTNATASDILIARQENETLKGELAALKGAINPKFDDAASVDTPVTLSYTYSYSGSRRSSQLAITYREFIRCAAPALHNPSGLGSVVKVLKRSLVERHGIADSVLLLKESDVQDALLHLVATGHVQMWSASTQEGKGYVTGYKLTPQGIKLWQEVSYTRSA